MNIPGLPSLFFLVYVLLFLPWISFRSARHLRAAASGQVPAIPRRSIWISTFLSQAALLALTWLVGRTFSYRIFAMPAPRALHVLLACAAVAACIVLRWISRAIRTPDERRKLAVYAWAPRSREEWLLWTGAVLLASIAEETAYRGVGMSILWYATGSQWIAILAMSTAFALAHSTQGRKSAAIIFLIALVMHALVAFTGTLVYAMIVHAVYDLATGYSISRTAATFDEAAA